MSNVLISIKKHRDKIIIRDESGQYVTDVIIAGSSRTENVNLSFKPRSRGVSIKRRGA